MTWHVVTWRDMTWHNFSSGWNTAETGRFHQPVQPGHHLGECDNHRQTGMCHYSCLYRCHYYCHAALMSQWFCPRLLTRPGTGRAPCGQPPPSTRLPGSVCWDTGEGCLKKFIESTTNALSKITKKQYFLVLIFSIQILKNWCLKKILKCMDFKICNCEISKL